MLLRPRGGVRIPMRSWDHPRAAVLFCLAGVGIASQEEYMYSIFLGPVGGDTHIRGEVSEHPEAGDARASV